MVKIWFLRLKTHRVGNGEVASVSNLFHAVAYFTPQKDWFGRLEELCELDCVFLQTKLNPVLNHWPKPT